MSRHHQAARGDASMTARVLAHYGRECWLRLPHCTGLATTRDHVIPLAAGGRDVLENCRPACRRCNSSRRDKIVSGTGAANVTVVMGPPAAGKSTHVREHARPEDVHLDLDQLARALMPCPPEETHVYPDYVRLAAIRARRGALEYLTRLTARVTVWLIHAVPRPDVLAEYLALHYRVLAIDPGRQIVGDRAHAARPRDMRDAVTRWYDQLAAGVYDDPRIEWLHPRPDDPPAPAIEATPSSRPW